MRTCLVVDDSPVIRKIARRILEELGFQVIEAGDGAEALACCRAAMPDVVLLDWRMPVMGGLEVLNWLRAQPGEQPRVIFCSGETELTRVREALAAGADEFIMKPFDADIMIGKLAAAGLA